MGAMAAGKRGLEKVRRAVFTVLFVLSMVASLLTLCAPLLVALGDVVASLLLAWKFACVGCYGLREHLQRYSFDSSLVDIPVVSVVRSILITGVYSLSEGPAVFNGPYFLTAAFCSFSSLVILFLKACLFTPTMKEMSSYLASSKLHLEQSRGLPLLLLSSLVFALGHVVVAYRTICRDRKRLLFNSFDPEAVHECKDTLSGDCNSRTSFVIVRKFKSDGKAKRMSLSLDGCDFLPANLLADMDSSFISCQGIAIHYKCSTPEMPSSLSTSPLVQSLSGQSPRNISPRKTRVERLSPVTPKSLFQTSRGFDDHFPLPSLYVPLLPGSSLPPSSFSNETTPLNLKDSFPISKIVGRESGKFGVVLVHGFGGGIFSWRHVMKILARQLGCNVVAFDRPGWGLSARPRRADWERNGLLNPYKLETQVDLLLAFCKQLGFSSVIIIGHDDGGLLALKVAEKVQSSTATVPNIEISGLILLSGNLSREVIPGFARILLHTSLRKKHMIRPLLRTEITQVINHRAWYNPAKLTSDVLHLYKAPLYMEGWDEALHEIGKLSFSTVLSPQNADALLQSVGDLPVLVVTGAEDALVPLQSVQAMASKLANSRLVAISGCGHLPHEECPRALLAALVPFIGRLVSPHDTSRPRR